MPWIHQSKSHLSPAKVSSFRLHAPYSIFCWGFGAADYDLLFWLTLMCRNVVTTCTEMTEM